MSSKQPGFINISDEYSSRQAHLFRLPDMPPETINSDAAMHLVEKRVNESASSLAW